MFLRVLTDPCCSLPPPTGWGRNQETASEDPLLAGEFGTQFSLGMQYDWGPNDGGQAPSTPRSGEMMAVASLKHVLGYSLEQWSPDGNWSENKFDRATFNAVIDSYVVFRSQLNRKN